VCREAPCVYTAHSLRTYASLRLPVYIRRLRDAYIRRGLRIYADSLRIYAESPSGKNMSSDCGDHTLSRRRRCDRTISKKWTFVHTENVLVTPSKFDHTVKSLFTPSKFLIIPSNFFHTIKISFTPLKFWFTPSKFGSHHQNFIHTQEWSCSHPGLPDF
jgi:hypothetical protein